MRFASAVTALAFSCSTAWAGPALDDDQKSAQPAQPAAPVAGQPPAPGELPPPSGVSPEDVIHYGVDIRLRSMHVPTGLLNLFVQHAADGASNFGYGIDVIRRRGDLELAIGLEHEQVTVGEGVWINKGDSVPGNDPDYVLSPADAQGGGLGWTTVDFTFINHKTINKYVQFRYGAGAGLGIINGELDHYNVHCAAGATNDNPSPGCVPARFGGTALYTDPNGNIITTATQYKYTSIPPVFPVIDALVGFQFHPIDKVIVDLELGIHTLPYFGANVGYYFN
jgi:hypothetical protein